METNPLPRTNPLLRLFFLKSSLSYFCVSETLIKDNFFKTSFVVVQIFPFLFVPAGSPSHGGDVVVYVKDINQLSLPTLFYSALVPVSVFMAWPIQLYFI